MTTHRHIVDQLSAYLDGALDESSRREVARHLETCPDCARELRLLKDTVGLVGTLPEVDLPEGFRAGLMERLAARRREADQSAGNARPAAHRRGVVVRLADRLRKMPDIYKGLAVAAALLIVALPVAEMVRDAGGLPGLPGMRTNLAADDSRAGGSAAAEPGLSAPQDMGEAQPSGAAKLPPPIHDMTSDSAEPADEGSSEFAAQSAPYLDAAAATGDTARRVIKESRLDVEVEDFEAACRRVAFLVESAGGYVQQSSVWVEDYADDRTRRHGSFVLRVPADSFAGLREQLADLGSLKRAEDSGRDVTAEFYDTQARLRNLERQEARLLELLGQAKTLDEILRVENELARVRGEIEMLQGRLNYLSRLTEMATIHLQVSEVMEGDEPDPAPGFWEELKRAVLGAVSLLGRALRRLALAIAAALPFIVALGLILAPLYWLYRSRRRDQ